MKLTNNLLERMIMEIMTESTGQNYEIGGIKFSITSGISVDMLKELIADEATNSDKIKKLKFFTKLDEPTANKLLVALESGKQVSDPIDEPADPIDEPVDDTVDEPVVEPVDLSTDDPDYTPDTTPDMFTRPFQTTSKLKGMDTVQLLSNNMFGKNTKVTERITNLCDMINNVDQTTITKLQDSVADNDGDGNKNDDKLSTLLATTFSAEMIKGFGSYNPTSAGFYFENWVISMFGGNVGKGAGGGATDIVINGEDWSLKFYQGIESKVTQAGSNLDKVNKRYNVLYGAKYYKMSEGKILLNEAGGQQIQRVDFYHLIWHPKPPKRNWNFGETVRTTGLKPFATLHFDNIAKLSSDPSSLKIQDATMKSLYTECVTLKNKISLLKAYLADYFQTITNDQARNLQAALGVDKTAEEVGTHVNQIQDQKIFYDPQKGKTTLDSQDKDVLKRNEKYVQDPKGRLPEVNILQDYANISNPISNSVIGKINQQLTGDTTVEKLKSFVSFCNKTMEENTMDTTNIQKSFASIIALENLYRIIHSIKVLEETGDNISGFNLENWLAAIGGGMTAGTNQELEDVVKMSGAGNDFTIEAFGLKNYQEGTGVGLSLELYWRVLYGKLKKMKSGNKKTQTIDNIKTLLGVDDLSNIKDKGDTWREQAFSYGRDLRTILIRNKKLKADASFGDEKKYMWNLVSGSPTKDELLANKALLKVDTKFGGNAAFIPRKYFKERGIVPVHGVTKVTFTSVAAVTKFKRGMSSGGEPLTKDLSMPLKLSFYNKTVELTWDKDEEQFQSDEFDDLYTPNIEGNYDLLGEIDFSKSDLNKLLSNLDAALDVTKNNFIKVFQAFNTFKYNIFIFFNDTNSQYLDAALVSYKSFKDLMNKSFKEMGFVNDQGIYISESIKMLDNLILEILQEAKKRKKIT
jgi:hypothetical protein